MEEKILIKSERYDIVKVLKRAFYVCIAFCAFAVVYTVATGEVKDFGDFIFVAFSAGMMLGIAGLICWLIYSWMHSYEIIVTDKRVYGQTAFGKRVDLPVDAVSAIGSSWPMGIAVATASGRIAFLMIKNRDAIHKCVSNLLIERQRKPIAAFAAPIKQEIPISNADELKKYKELLDSGVITQDEFTAKKKQLLGL